MTYPRPLQVIHWTVATLVTCQLAIAVALTQLRSLAYGQLVLGLHRQLGLVILLLVLARFVVAHRHKPPLPTAQLPSWQTHAAVIVHRLFFAVLIVQPLLGVFVAWARGDSVSLFGLLQVAAPWEISDAVREQLMTLHAAIAMLLFALCVVHIGAVVFNRMVRRVSVIDRMLPASAPDRLVNRVPIAAQLTLAFGLVVAIALTMGINAVATYREFNEASSAFQEGEVAASDQMRASQVAWKELLGLAAAGRTSEDAARVQELVESAKSGLTEAVAHTSAGEIHTRLDGILQQLAGLDAAALSQVPMLREIDTRLQDLVDSQSAAAFQRRTDNDERAARGQDLIVVTVLPMILAGLIAALLLARSVTGSVSRMSTLIKSIESERREADINVSGEGEFAALTRDIMSMRVAVEERSNAAAQHRAEFEAERARAAEEQQQREVAAERQGRIERQTHRERLAGEFEMQVAVIVDTVARTAQELTSTAGSMTTSAANTTQRSRDASSIAEQTSGTASLISQGTQDLSNTARSVRENAEQSQARAVLAVQEAAAAREQIDRLLAAARRIGSITDVIAGVARQTNLLAINARIEAARAGEVGRGFSIVANEVKDLANQTRLATHGIGKQIEELTTAAASSSRSLERLREVIQGLEGAATAICSSSAEQFASTRVIAERVAEISSSTQSVAQNIHEAQNTASATEALSDEVAKAAGVMDEQAVHLREQVARFLVQLRERGASPTAPAPRTREPGAETARPAHTAFG
jgi:methyl-accepting chemotaxis protein/cytochrome b561